jgi:putative transposase
VLETRADVRIVRGPPAYVRSDNGPEFIATALREWIVAVGSQTADIAPGSPWENGYCESFNSKLRDELLDGEIFFSLAEAQVLIAGLPDVHLADHRLESARAPVGREA